VGKKAVMTIASVVERIKKLSGAEETLNCELIALEKQFGILKHISMEEYRFGTVTIPSGHISFRFYWPNRSYHLLKIFDADGRLRVNRIKLADSVELSPTEIVWRDLSADLMILPNGTTQLIRGEEKPARDDTWLHIYIEANKQELLRKYREIVAETDRLMEKYCAEFVPAGAD
jgi:hypothetical protein